MRLQAFLPLAFAATRTLAMNMGDEAYRAGHGMVGYGIPFARPRCAFSCRDAISGARLQCSDVHEMEGMDLMVMTSPDCYAKDDAFLQTLAVCLSTRCSHIPAWELEKYWKANVPGTFLVQPDPKQTYQQALAKVNGTPSVVYAETGSLNQTSIVSDELYIPAFNSNEVFGNQEAQQVKYGLVILLSGVIIPIAVSLLRFFPFPAALRAKFNAWIIDPPLFGSNHDSPVLYGLTHVPTRGQALFISYFIVVNVVLNAVNYEYANPNTWYPGKKWRWMLMLVSNRLGLIGFANMPLLFLYAGRNNFLLWLTDWSHSTFLLLHRWIAGIATLEAILHSILYLAAYAKAGTHNEEAKEPYWYWGIIATLGMTILFPCSITPIRKKMYELFLAWHVAISILVVAGCYWHIVFCFSHKWGYETWIIMCMAIWAFDRVFRVVRLGRYGIKTAQITIIDDDYVRVVIPNVSASGHAYLYFPTLTWRVWENHPFSVASSMLVAPPVSSVPKGPKISHDMEKQINVIASPTSEDNISRSSGSSNIVNNTLSAGITFYIRTETGITSAVRKRTSLPVLLESGYSSHSPSALNKSPILVAIAGGVGITAVLPHLATHPGRVKLFWGARTQSLVDDVVHSGALSRVEYDTVVGSRLAVREILEGELAAAGNVEVAVLVSGPEGMIDEVRNVVGGFVRRGSNARVGLHVESFSW